MIQIWMQMPVQTQMCTLTWKLPDGMMEMGSHLKSPPAYSLAGWEGGDPPATVLSMGFANSSNARCSVPATASTILGATKLLDTNSCSVSADRLAVPPSGQIRGRPKAPVYATLCRPCNPNAESTHVEACVHYVVPTCWCGHCVTSHG